MMLDFFSPLQDEHVLRHIVKNNPMKPIIDAFISNGNRYNLLHSAVLELLDYIRKVLSLSLSLKPYLFIKCPSLCVWGLPGSMRIMAGQGV